MKLLQSASAGHSIHGEIPAAEVFSGQSSSLVQRGYMRKYSYSNLLAVSAAAEGGGVHTLPHSHSFGNSH